MEQAYHKQTTKDNFKRQMDINTVLGILGQQIKTKWNKMNLTYLKNYNTPVYDSNHRLLDLQSNALPQDQRASTNKIHPL